MSFYKDKHIWIIGASSGIGRALAVHLASLGAKLVLSARNKEQLDQLNEEIGGIHHVFQLDITDCEMIKRTVHAVQASIPRLDSVIFMAAVYAASESERTDPVIINQIVDVNLTSAINVSYALLPVLKEQGGGQLALCASVAGYVGLPAGQPYSATKAGLINFAESLRVETDRAIDIKVINPGFVKTRMTDKNEFEMPMIITSEKAAQHIAKGLQKRSFEVHFPKAFTTMLKVLRLLPYPLFFAIARRIKT
ncbi:MAG: SDR family NAD(P)-dependent oxidoreductase [Rickettsiales bacterium]|nr:SDR family NAD(P)-dependent oxidoreductase [Rickettsiales bacterium]